jgi:N-acetylmuramoyl-L-alanine amidase
MSSCLVELGFINSETDNKLYDEKLEEYAEAIANAIADNLKTAEAQ